MTTRKKKAVKKTIRGKKTAKKVAAIAASAQQPAAKARKEQITLRLDADVIDFYRAMGEGYQAKMSDFLGVARKDEQVRRLSKNQIAGPPWYEESKDHGVMGNRLARPRKEQLTLRVDSDTVEWFRLQGKGYQSKMNRLLRLVMVQLLPNAEYERRR
jgi:uncharacterized protein (DUF4415 family)